MADAGADDRDRQAFGELQARMIQGVQAHKKASRGNRYRPPPPPPAPFPDLPPGWGPQRTCSPLPLARPGGFRRGCPALTARVSPSRHPQAANVIKVKEREKKRCQLTLQEIEGLPNDVRAFKSVGKAFILSTKVH